MTETSIELVSSGLVLNNVPISNIHTTTGQMFINAVLDSLIEVGLTNYTSSTATIMHGMTTNVDIDDIFIVNVTCKHSLIDLSD
mmetsp:Transcript_23409/g.26826  ORF Transcript_23409/g.26826 Transcript_23409/m.26826 type:complete len:84 (-) Transcript_23409:122-373(-)